MKLYEIDMRINQIFEDAYNSEDGILTDDQEAELLALEENKANIAEWVAKEMLNIRSDIASITAEINRLGEIKNRLKKQDENMTKVIDRIAGGQNMDFGVAKFSYRKSSAVIIDDQERFAKFLSYEHPDCIITKTDINKSKVKDLLKKGSVPDGYAHIEERRKGSLK